MIEETLLCLSRAEITPFSSAAKQAQQLREECTMRLFA